MDTRYNLSPRRFLRVPTINVLNKIIENIKKFPMKFSFFNAEKILCILHGQVFVMGIFVT